MGYGLAAGRAIEKGETVLKIPRETWGPFSAQHALDRATAMAPPFVESVRQLESSLVESSGRSEGPQHMSGSILLAIQMLLDLRVPEVDQSPYVRFLPREVDSPLLWEPEEMKELAGTGALRGVLARSEFIRVVHESLFPGGQGGLPRTDLAWMLSLLLSRAHSGRDEPMSLVPLLCCANHSLEPTGEHGYEEESESFTVVALRDHAPGEEVFISYGQHDNARLLWQYGFVLPENRFTKVHIDWGQGAHPEDPLAGTKMDLLERHGVAPSQTEVFYAFPHAAGLPPPGLLAKCRILALERGDLPPQEATGEQGGREIDATQVINSRNEEEASEAVRALARMALSRCRSPPL